MEFTKEMQIKRKTKQKIPMRKRSKRSLATKITVDVRMAVKLRDNGMCIVCGSMVKIEIHHLLARSHGGMGIENNLVCLCQQHHRELHQGSKHIKYLVLDRLITLYPDVSTNDRKYTKWR